MVRGSTAISTCTMALVFTSIVIGMRAASRNMFMTQMRNCMSSIHSIICFTVLSKKEEIAL
jgi:hypothetical protein